MPYQSTGYRPGYPGQYPYNANAYPQQPNNPAYPQYPQTSNYANASRPTYPMQTQAGTQQSHVPLSSQPSLTEEQIKASLLSAVHERMSRKLDEAYGQALAEVQSLQKTQDDLNKGKLQLEDMLTRLENEQREVDRNIEILKQKDSELDEMITKMETQTSKFDVDSAIMPIAPLYKQILNSFSEEQALEDAMYHLGDALRKGVVDIDVFLKNIRELSRRQFLLRALITKCRQKAGLPELI
jgi:ESCRT-I complex subunit TSG101